MLNYEYDDFDWWDDNTPSAKELELNEKGFNFITNFSPDSEPFYLQSAENHKIRFLIAEEAYGFGGHRVHGCKAFYVDSAICNLTDFWNTFDKLKGVAK